MHFRDKNLHGKGSRVAASVRREQTLFCVITAVSVHTIGHEGVLHALPRVILVLRSENKR